MSEALDIAVRSLERDHTGLAGFRRHRHMAVAAGAVGGFFGLPALLVELPVTTVIMLRSIADTARRQGEDLDSLESRLACLEVFALGGRTRSSEYSEIGYYEVRLALGFHFSMAVGAVGERMAIRTLPSAVSLVRGIAGRFGVVVSDKAALQLVPLLGAATGALVNATFMSHFETVAEGHFTIRRLERAYGRETVRTAYRSLRQMEAQAERVYSDPV